MHRSVAWVLAHTASVWAGVIRARIDAGHGPEDRARIFRIENDTFAEVRFDGGRANLVLAIDMRPAGRR